MTECTGEGNYLHAIVHHQQYPEHGEGALLLPLAMMGGGIG